MTWTQAAVLAALAVLVTLLARGRHAPGAVFGGVALAFVLAGLVDVPQALAAFTNAGLVTVVLLLLVSVTLDKARLLEQMADALLRGGYRAALFKLTASTALVSALLNNTAVVASLIGPLRASRAHAASRLLLPMCYAATIGGTLTLVGTSTNLLVASFVIDRGLAAPAMFDLLPVGLCLLAAGIVVMAVLYPRLLPARALAEPAAAEYFVEAAVQPGSPLVGRSAAAGGLRHLGHLFLAEIVRGGRLIAPVQPDEVLAAGDVLVFAGDVTRIDLLARFGGLELAAQRDGLPLDNLVEVVVAADARIARRTLREVDFRARFDAAVVAVRRGPQRLPGSLGQTAIAVGDTLVLAVGPDFDKRPDTARDFVVVSRRGVAKFTDPRRGWWTLGAFGAVIALAALGVVDLLLGLLVLLVGFLALGWTRAEELRRHMPWQLFFVIGSALIVARVMLDTGTAQWIAGGVLALAAPLGPYGALAGVLLLTWALTETMTNNAAAALAFPVALGMAETLGVSTTPFVMAVIYGASASFLTPYGYQTNLMVMGPGQYTLGDYLRAGAPLALAYVATALVAIPVFFPL